MKSTDDRTTPPFRSATTSTASKAGVSKNETRSLAGFVDLSQHAGFRVAPVFQVMTYTAPTLLPQLVAFRVDTVPDSVRKFNRLTHIHGLRHGSRRNVPPSAFSSTDSASPHYFNDAAHAVAPVLIHALWLGAWRPCFLRLIQRQ